MKIILLLFISAFVLPCGAQQNISEIENRDNPQLYNFSGYSGKVELTDRYTLNYFMHLSFDEKDIKVLWKRAEVVDKETKDTVDVDMNNLKCALICNPPVVYAGVFDVKYQDQQYIVQFHYDIRTYVNKKEGSLESLEKCSNVADLDPEVLRRFPMK